MPDTQNTNDDIEKMKSDIQGILDILDSFKRSSSIPRDVETAFRERILNFTVVGATTTFGTQSVSVPSTPTNITVPAQPSGAISIVINGVTYNLLYK